MNDRPPISVKRTLVAFALSLAFIAPFLFLLSTALRTPADFALNPGGLPAAFTLHNLQEAWVEARLGLSLIHI